MSKIYRCQIQVRGYELDSYEHVNHAVYINYLEHARWQLLNEEGITLARLNEWKRWPVIAEIHVRYVKPAFMGETLDIETQITSIRRVAFTMEQRIYRQGTLILEAKISSVTVNEKGKPDELPEEFKNLYTAAMIPA